MLASEFCINEDIYLYVRIAVSRRGMYDRQLKEDLVQGGGGHISVP